MNDDSATLAAGYDGIVCDLDGVVYRGPAAVDHAVEALEQARLCGLKIAYATNNASRPPVDVAEHLQGLGLTVGQETVITSSQAGARRLAQSLPAGSAVLAVGGEGVALALRDVGLVAVRASDVTHEVRPVAVLQGLGVEVTWADLAEAAYAIQSGACWVATNADTTLPNDRGIAPGNGALVDAVRHAVNTDPVVVGKPRPPLYELSAEVLETRVQRTLAIGDRLDTDIEGAVNTGMDSLYVLTGVSRLADVCLAPAGRRPTYLAEDLRALHEKYLPAVVQRNAGSSTTSCGSARVQCDTNGFAIRSTATPSQLLRCVVAAAWNAQDQPGLEGAAARLAGMDAAAWTELEGRVLSGASSTPS